MKSMFVSLRLRGAAALLVLSLVCALSTFAAAQTSSIAGTITDSSGAVISGAEITARNTATNESTQRHEQRHGSFFYTEPANRTV